MNYNDISITSLIKKNIGTQYKHQKREDEKVKMGGFPLFLFTV
jgi:hypothetical protein